MELKEYIAIARRWMWLFALSTAVAATGAWVGTRFMNETFLSQSTVMVGQAVADPNPSGMTIYIAQQLAGNYAQMATRGDVLQGVAERLELDESRWQQLRGTLRVQVVPGQQLIEIRAIHTSPEWAQAIAQAAALELVAQSPGGEKSELAADREFVQGRLNKIKERITQAEQETEAINLQIEQETSARGIAELSSRKQALESQTRSWDGQLAQLRISLSGSSVNSIEVIENAGPAVRVGPNVRMNILLAAAIGLGLAIAAVLLLEYLDDTVKTSEDLDRKLSIPSLGTIALMPDLTHRAEGLITATSPRSPTAEAYRVVRTNLRFGLIDSERKAVVVTSANPGEGKSTTAANLAVVMAQSGQRIILVDADLRRPSLHRFFGLTNDVGLTSLLLDGELDRSMVMRSIPDIPGLEVLTSGPLPPNPSETLQSDRTRDLLNRLKDDADVVIFDSPPLLVVTDAAVLATFVEGTILVFESGVTRTDAARKAVDSLAKVGVKPLGAVVNRLDRERVGRYYYQYRYNESYDSYYGAATGDDEDQSDPPSPRRRNALGRFVDAITSLLS